VSEQNPEEIGREKPDHWQLMRDVVAFQFKLAMDGLRDVLLSPVSIAAALYGLFSNPENPGHHFNRLLKFGRQTDVWINLFGATDHYKDENSKDENAASSDAYIQKLEDLLIAEYRKGGLVRGLKDSTDGLIERIRRERSQDE